MKKILIVEDDFDILYLVQMTLKMNGYESEGISNWQNIDSSIRSFLPKLILMDVSLTGADGRNICKKIKGAPETKDIAVILFSAHDNLAESIIDCKAQAFIEKPYQLSHLLATVKKFL